MKKIYKAQNKRIGNKKKKEIDDIKKYKIKYIVDKRKI